MSVDTGTMPRFEDLFRADVLLTFKIILVSHFFRKDTIILSLLRYIVL